MKVNSDVTSFSIFNLKSEKSLACLEKVSGVHEQMKSDQVTMKQTLENLKPELKCSEMSRTREW